jgi:hypothetical protein
MMLLTAAGASHAQMGGGYLVEWLGLAKTLVRTGIDEAVVARTDALTAPLHSLAGMGALV